MIQVILIVHLLLALALVAVVLLQRSEGGALGMGGGTMGGMMSTRGTANLLTRATAVLAACFIATSLTLAIMSSSNRAPKSILDRPGSAPPAPSAPAAPAPGPAVPLGK
ncbi:MAG: preprotein translocase subunit SecG [Pseudomonadota bacterium]|nr:preprotein translocase subunit SecG [Pseudomonadota bacterium]